jgi:aspartate kinase
VTSTLLGAATAAAAGDADGALAAVDGLRGRHQMIAHALLGPLAPEAIQRIDRECDDLSHLLRSIAVIQEVTPRLLDQCASFGEGWSSYLLARALERSGVAAAWVDARSVMITSDAFTKAEPVPESIAARAAERFAPLLEAGTVIVTQGYVGATSRGVTTTLGRGGSDYSAALLGAALLVREIQIWTDVDGILTADPNVVPTAHSLDEVTFAEAAELAYFGAKVLHPSTLLPAIRTNIPVRVLNTKRPEARGTLIVARPSPSAPQVVRSIASKGGITVVTIQSTRMLMAYGFLARVFEVFAQYRRSIDVVATSEVGVSLTLDDDRDLDAIRSALEAFADVEIETKKAVVSVVGEGLKHSAGLPGRVFGALGRAGVRTELISQGGSEINITFVVAEEEAVRAVRALHQEFFPAGGPTP